MANQGVARLAKVGGALLAAFFAPPGLVTPAQMPYFLRGMQELKLLETKPVAGVTFEPNETDGLEWTAHIVAPVSGRPHTPM